MMHQRKATEKVSSFKICCTKNLRVTTSTFTLCNGDDGSMVNRDTEVLSFKNKENKVNSFYFKKISMGIRVFFSCSKI